LSAGICAQSTKPQYAGSEALVFKTSQETHPKKGSLIWAAIAVLCCGLPAMGQTPAQTGKNLETQVQWLQQRLQSAESRLQQLEGNPPVIPPAPTGDTPVWPATMEMESEDDAEEAKPEGEDLKLDDRLGLLEKDWKGFQESEAKKKADAAKKPSFKLGGRVHLDTWSFPEDTPGIGFFEHPTTGDDPEDRIFFRRIRFEAGGDIFENMLYRMQIEFSETSDPTYRDVYLGFTQLPGNTTVLFGNQKRPLGLDHLNSSRYNVFMERPLVIEAFNEDARRVGVGGYSYTDDLRYNFRYGVFLLENNSDDGQYLGDSQQMSGNFRLASIPWYDEASDGRGYFHWAVAGMLARPDGNASPVETNSNEGRFRTRSELRSDSRWLDTGRIPGADWYEIAGLETIFNYAALQLVGEQQFNWVQRDDSTRGTGPDVFFHGGYFYVAYFLTGEHVPIDRESSTIERTKPFENFFLVERLRGGTGTGWGAWQVALRMSYLDLSDQDIQGGVGRNVTLGLNWWWTSHSRLQVNLVRGNITDHRPQGGFTEGDFWALGTRMAVDF
jgi:phosphate-selective porin OprO/OprP